MFTGSATEITNALVESIAIYLRPIAAIDGRSFVNLMAVVEPGYICPSRKHFVE